MDPEPEAYAVLSQLKVASKELRRACSQVTLLNHKIKSAKTRCAREKCVKRISFKENNKFKLNSLETLRDLIRAHASSKSEQVHTLQTKLSQLTGGASAQFIIANSK